MSEVMKHFPNTLNRGESDEMVIQIQTVISERGWGLRAVEEKSSGQFIGLHEVTLDLPFSPCVEIGWRLSKPYCGKGYASEAGLVVLDFSFSSLQLPAVFSFTTFSNESSRAVMERLNMENTHHILSTPAFQKGMFLERMCSIKAADSNGTFSKI
ncbi:MAG: GNAT family N-acetyltransferase [Pseudomonadales bacterium]|nr:GNAT family N-acetyltransferase [Pseudomonadales bacterium]